MSRRTLLANWDDELQRWAPSATTAVLPDGPRRDRVWRSRLRRAHVILTTYEQLRSLPLPLVESSADLVIADEAHKLRNRGSQMVGGFRMLRSERIWALTGTPVERDAEDSRRSSHCWSRVASARTTHVWAPACLGLGRARLFSDGRSAMCSSDLPPVLRRHEILDLTAEQRGSYRSAIHRSGGTVESFLALFNELRMICDLDPTSGASQLDRVEDLLDEIRKSGEKAIVFPLHLEPLRALQRRSEGNLGRVEALTGELSLAQRKIVLERFREDASVVALLSASSRMASEGP